MENNIRQPDGSFNDILIGSNVNQEENLDDDIQKAMTQSLEEYNIDFERQCQENVIENQIQEILQQEYDQKNIMKESRRKILEPIMIRLTRIDPTKEYTNIIEKFIDSGLPLSYEEYNKITKFIGKPSLVSIINDCVVHE
tara:strand:- start:201 stop:620 length:420 start_codon:yes stop_codon:yes gene_type:complete